jgi:hypothetical protein
MSEALRKQIFNTLEEIKLLEQMDENKLVTEIAFDESSASYSSLLAPSPKYIPAREMLARLRERHADLQSQAV